MTTTATTTPAGADDSVPPMPGRPGSIDAAFGEAFDALLVDLRKTGPLSTKHENLLKQALRTIVTCQAKLITLPPGDDAEGLKLDMASAINIVELVAEIKAFNAAVIARRFAWSVFDRMLTFGLSALA